MKRVSLITLCLLLSAASPSFAQQDTSSARDLFTNFGQEQNPEQKSTTVKPRNRRRKAPSQGRPGTKVTIELNRDGQISWSRQRIFRSGDRIAFTSRPTSAATSPSSTKARRAAESSVPYPGVSHEVTPVVRLHDPQGRVVGCSSTIPGPERASSSCRRTACRSLQQFLASSSRPGRTKFWPR